MRMFLSTLFHKSLKQYKGPGSVAIPKNPAEWPASWKRIEYKSYGNLSQVGLPDSLATSLSKSIAARKSTRSYTAKPLSLHTLSHLLRYSCGEVGGAVDNARKRRAQPSGGAMFPIETYVLVFRSSLELPSGVYHYAVATHSLDILWQRSFTAEEIGQLYIYEKVQDAAAAIVMTSVFARNQQKYGERGYRLALIEAGHIGQNVYLLSAELGLGCCAMAGSYDHAIESILGIDGVTESVVYSVIVGEPKR